MALEDPNTSIYEDSEALKKMIQEFHSASQPKLPEPAGLGEALPPASKGETAFCGVGYDVNLKSQLENIA